MIAAIAEKIENDRENLRLVHDTSQIQHGALEASYFRLFALPEPGSTLLTFRTNLPYAVLVYFKLLIVIFDMQTCRTFRQLLCSNQRSCIFLVIGLKTCCLSSRTTVLLP